MNHLLKIVLKSFLLATLSAAESQASSSIPYRILDSSWARIETPINQVIRNEAQWKSLTYPSAIFVMPKTQKPVRFDIAKAVWAMCPY